MRRRLSAYTPYYEIEKQAFLGSVVPMAQGVLPAVASIGAQFYLPHLLRKNLQRFSRLSSMREHRAARNPGMPMPAPIFSKGVRNFIDKTLYNPNSFGGSLINNLAMPYLVGKVTDPLVNTLSSGLNLLPSFQKTGMFLKRGKLSPSLLKFAQGTTMPTNPAGVNFNPASMAAANNQMKMMGNLYANLPQRSATIPSIPNTLPASGGSTTPSFKALGTVGKAVGVAGAGAGLYNAYNDFQNGNYGNAAIQTASSVAPYALPALQKALPMAAGKTLGKFIPYAGTAISAADAANRWRQGDRWGAAISGLQAGANLIPGAGTAVSMGLEAVDALRPERSRYDLSNSAQSVKNLAES